MVIVVVTVIVIVMAMEMALVMVMLIVIVIAIAMVILIVVVLVIVIVIVMVPEGYQRGYWVSKGVLGTYRFVPGAQCKPRGAQYSPGVPKTTLNAPLGLYWVIKGGIGHLRVCTGCLVQTCRCPILPRGPQNNSE